MKSRRILITGLSSVWGGLLAQALEREADVETIVGIDEHDPRHELARTEFVRVGTDAALLRRIITAAGIDTVLDTRLIDDPLIAPLARAREVNVAGTRELLAACAGSRSPVRRVILKSSARYYGSEPDAPAFIAEDQRRTHRPRTAIEEDLLAAEAAAEEFAAANPNATVTVMRLADPIGAELRGSHLALLNLPAVPAILGFDPRCQFVHLDDAIAALAYAARHELPGAFNVAADGVLSLSEIVSLLGKPLLPVLPPWGTVFAAGQLRRLGVPIPLEMLRQLRFGLGLDNRRLKAAGFRYHYTTREAVLKLRAAQRLRPLLGSGQESYRYEREVEEFLRWSPSVHGPREVVAARDGDAASAEGGRFTTAYDRLGEAELIELISSLEPEALRRLRAHEAEHQGRSAIIEALDRNLERYAARSGE